MHSIGFIAMKYLETCKLIDYVELGKLAQKQAFLAFKRVFQQKLR